MGLERLAAMMQNVDSIFDVDTIKAIRDHVCEIAGCKYGDSHKKGCFHPCYYRPYTFSGVYGV